MMASTTSAAVRSTDPFTSSSFRGVNPRETMRRSRARRGSSMLIMDPKNSRKSGGMSPMFVPRLEQNRSACRLASRMCSWRVSDQ